MAKKKLITFVQVHLAGQESEEDPVIVGMPCDLLDQIEDTLDQAAQLLKARFNLSHTEACQRSRALLMHMLEHRPKLPVADEDPEAGS